MSCTGYVAGFEEVLQLVRERGTPLCAFFFFCCCYRGGGLGEWRGHFGRAVIWLLLSVCHPFCLQAKPTGDERLHFSPPCQCCDWLKGVRLSWLPISVCWLGVAGFCWKVQSFFFFSFLLLGRGLTRLQGCIQTLWPKTSGARQDIMKHDLMQRYHHISAAMV